MPRNDLGQFIAGKFEPYYKVIDGVQHKVCNGPAHDEPTYLPATEKYFHVRKTESRNGQLVSRCRLCINWEKLKSPGLSGYIPASTVRQYFIESINRVGLMEAARRIGMNYNHYSDIANSKTRYVRKATLRKVMLELISMRRKGEVRHRDDIISGAAKRGKQLKPVTDRSHLYKQHGDSNAESRRKHRAREIS